MKSKSTKLIVLSIIAFCTSLFSSNEIKAQCTASMTYTNPSAGQYQFTAALSPNSAWMYYYWSFGDGNNAQGPNASVTHIYSFIGTYQVCVTAIDSTNGCSNTYCQYIPVSTTACNLNPQFSSMDMGGGNVMFTDNSVDNGGGTITAWHWDFGDGGTSTLQNPSHTYINNNSYGVMLTIYNSQGCTDTVYNYVNVFSTSCNLWVSANNAFAHCGQCDGTLSPTMTGGTGPYTFLWATGATTQNISGLCPAYYDITVTDAMGCSASNVFTVFSEGVTGSISIDTSSAANNIIVFTGNAVGGPNPHHYSFYFPNGNPSYSQTQITTVQYPGPGNYYVCMSVYDSTWSCYDSLCTTVIFGGGMNCTGFSSAVTGTQTSSNNWNFYATATGGVSPYTYQWYFPNGGTSTCGNNQATACGNFTAPGTYTACCYVTDAVGCTSYNCFSIVVQANNCNAQFYPYSYSDSMMVYNYSTASASAVYTWDFGDGTVLVNNTMNQYFGHHYANAGNYTICLYLADAVNNCYDTLCQNVYACGLDANITYTMNGNIITLTGTITGNYNSFGWYGPTQSYPSVFTITDTLATNGTYTYAFWAQDTNTGCYDSAYVSVNTNFPTQNTISGHLFNDLNGNGIQDASEPPVANNYVIVAGNWIQTNSNGDYSLNVADGTWNVSIMTPNGWIQTFPVSPSAYTVSVSGGMNLTGVDFGMKNSYTSVCGVVYNDANQNGMQDAGELGLQNVWVEVGSYWALTDATGHYTVNIALGTYNVHLYQIPATGVLITPNSGSYSITTTTAGVAYCGNDFGIYFNPSLQDLSVEILPYTTVTPGFPAWYDISYCNNGGVPVNGTITMNYDANLVFASASPSPSSVDAVNHILTWNLGVINPGICGWIWVDFDASTSTPIGVDAFSAVTIQPISGDDVPANNIDTLHQTTNASWDPNEKEVSPHGIGAQGLINPTQPLDYTIHFQNTGTAPAVNVEVVDTLSSNLDLQTFEVTSYSHPMTATLDQSNGIVRFFFANIMLPDSGTDLQGSMGSLQYHIEPKSGLAQGTVINNFADIYFDFNPPVRTQTTVNTIDYTLSAPVILSSNEIKIYPNPANDQLTIDNGQLTGTTFKIMDVLGKELNLPTTNHQPLTTINVSSLSKGIYFVKIISSNGETLEVRKLTVQ